MERMVGQLTMMINKIKEAGWTTNYLTDLPEILNMIFNAFT